MSQCVQFQLLSQQARRGNKNCNRICFNWTEQALHLWVARDARAVLPLVLSL